MIIHIGFINDKFSGIYYGKEGVKVFFEEVEEMDANSAVTVALNPTYYGKRYTDKKDAIRNKAIELSHYDLEGISYGELAVIQDFFERYGKRYGLLTEFHENGIC